MSEVHYWEVFCVTDNRNEYVWSDTKPTTCPINAGHTISTMPGPVIVKTLNENKVELKEELDGVTQGIFQLEGYNESIPSGDPGNTHMIIMTWPYPITLINGWFVSSDLNKSDKLDVDVGPNTTIGYITSPLYTGNSTVTVNTTAIENAYKGYYVNITDGTNNDNLGRIIDINTANSEIITENSSTNDYNPITPSYIQITVRVIKNFYINLGNQRYAFAEKKVGGKFLPKDIAMCINYTNNDGNAKSFAYNLEYLY